MSRMKWNEAGTRTYETGVYEGAFFKGTSDGTYPAGTPWNGLTTVTEKPSGAEVTKQYADNTVYGSVVSAEEFSISIEAFKAAEGFEDCDGSKEIAPGIFAGQQGRKPFGFAYKTLIGNDTESNEHGYKIHIVYGLLASPSEKAYATVSDSAEMPKYTWEAKSTPVATERTVDGKTLKPISLLTFDSTKCTAAFMEKLDALIYGSESVDGHLPLPDEVFTLYDKNKAAG